MTALGTVKRFRPSEGTAFHIGGDKVSLKGDPGERSEAFSVVEYEGAAGVPGPPPHLHRTFEEAWYILEGAVEFISGTERIEATPGAYLFVPRGTPHTFRVVGDRPARWLGIFSPGRFVNLLVELGKVMPSTGPPDPAAIGQLFLRYDTELTG